MPPRNSKTLAAAVRLSDPAVDKGAFTSLTCADAMMWLFLLGVKETAPDLQHAMNTSENEAKELALKKLRRALWDVQRFDLLFPGHVYSETPNFCLTRLPSWPNWQHTHPELASWKLGPQHHGYEDMERLTSYVMWQFSTMAFSQAEIAHGVMMNPRKNIAGAWIGTKKIMSNASLFTTCYGGEELPFLTYFSTDKGPGTSMLMMEFLDVKQAVWPEPDAKFLEQLKASQEFKYGAPADGPLHPMMQSPKVPIVVVRYSYLEGRRADGSRFTLHLESVLKKQHPKGTSAAQLRRALQECLDAGEEMPEVHLRMFARLLAHNAGLVDGEWAADLQGRGNLSAAVATETRISFFVPCPRIRFRALEEIETGEPVVADKQCALCGKDAPKLMCSSCKAVCYCSTDCSTAEWLLHKLSCRMSQTLLTEPASLPPNTLYVPMRAVVLHVVDHGFAHGQEAVRMGGGIIPGDCPRNEHGVERFICRVTLPRAGTCVWDEDHARVVQSDPVRSAFLCDRRRSVQVRVRPGDVPFHEAGFEQLVALMEQRGEQGELLYLWAKRIGDCLEVDLWRIPRQMDWE